jgi:hypothetical protein
MSVKDARSKWSTHDKLQQWFDDATKDLISKGLVIDREVRNCNGDLLSELDFHSDQVTHQIINMEKTQHHNLSITGDKG